ncbi:MAG TPA: hypothetical protein VMB25_12295 [Bryobacteraceae bacterium]|nr:hypothetical protein [Bryobacteraceae bacterium]
MLEVTKDEAILLLRKWQEEKTLLQCSLSFDRTRCITLGRIEKIDEEEAQVNGSSLDESGGKYGLILRFMNVRRFCFDDVKLPQQQPDSVMERAAEALEQYLFMDLGFGCFCAIFATREPHTDLPNIT